MPFNKRNVARREFLASSLKLAGSAALLGGAFIPNPASAADKRKNYTVQEIIDTILKEVPGAPFKNTVDTIKSGSGDQVVTGIVTTMFATVKVIQQAIHQHANFIIAHEPTFYNHEDNINWVPDSSIVQKKLQLLQDNKITIWRFHDYWHSVKPDGITYGVVKNAGWLPYFSEGKKVIRIPALSLLQLAEHLKKSLGIEKLRVIGDPRQTCSNIAVLPGAWGGQLQMKTAEAENPDVLVVGEVHEWETAEYIRDRRALGSNMALIDLGHTVSEEPGMEWLVSWLQPKVPGLPVIHVASGNPFFFV